MTERIFRYVPHSQVDERLKEGWVFAADLGPPHCFYAVLMEKPQEKKNLFARRVEFVLSRIRNRNTKRR